MPIAFLQESEAGHPPCHTHTSLNKHNSSDYMSAPSPDQEKRIHPEIEGATPRVEVQRVYRHRGFPFKHIICDKYKGKQCLFHTEEKQEAHFRLLLALGEL